MSHKLGFILTLARAHLNFMQERFRTGKAEPFVWNGVNLNSVMEEFGTYAQLEAYINNPANQDVVIRAAIMFNCIRLRYPGEPGTAKFLNAVEHMAIGGETVQYPVVDNRLLDWPDYCYAVQLPHVWLHPAVTVVALIRARFDELKCLQRDKKAVWESGDVDKQNKHREEHSETVQDTLSKEEAHEVEKKLNSGWSVGMLFPSEFPGPGERARRKGLNKRAAEKRKRAQPKKLIATSATNATSEPEVISRSSLVSDGAAIDNSEPDAAGQSVSVEPVKAVEPDATGHVSGEREKAAELLPKLGSAEDEHTESESHGRLTPESQDSPLPLNSCKQEIPTEELCRNPPKTSELSLEPAVRPQESESAVQVAETSDAHPIDSEAPLPESLPESIIPPAVTMERDRHSNDAASDHPSHSHEAGEDITARSQTGPNTKSTKEQRKAKSAAYKARKRAKKEELEEKLRQEQEARDREKKALELQQQEARNQAMQAALDKFHREQEELERKRMEDEQAEMARQELERQALERQELEKQELERKAREREETEQAEKTRREKAELERERERVRERVQEYIKRPEIARREMEEFDRKRMEETKKAKIEKEEMAKLAKEKMAREREKAEQVEKARREQEERERLRREKERQVKERKEKEEKERKAKEEKGRKEKEEKERKERQEKEEKERKVRQEKELKARQEKERENKGVEKARHRPAQGPQEAKKVSQKAQGRADNVRRPREKGAPRQIDRAPNQPSGKHSKRQVKTEREGGAGKSTKTQTSKKAARPSQSGKTGQVRDIHLAQAHTQLQRTAALNPTAYEFVPPAENNKTTHRVATPDNVSPRTRPEDAARLNNVSMWQPEPSVPSSSWPNTAPGPSSFADNEAWWQDANQFAFEAEQQDMFYLLASQESHLHEAAAFWDEEAIATEQEAIRLFELAEEARYSAARAREIAERISLRSQEMGGGGNVSGD
ncbi:hypothetical protein QBC38DRAFT_167906 [Podospora fimiseda]|uniref:Uncharacterized protein n=1 Tax=Podospora fimiseda TaxID=252190 RepID=A0AAN7BRC5_9PEZI|nr:hypothetical protein QBC38DRAFT_167906 [Podospora fimiseda]